MATTKVGFYTPETAKIIAETVAYLRRNGLVQQKGKGNDPQVRGLFGLVFKTPASGIPAMSGTTPGKAYCPAYFIDPATSQLVTVTDNAGVAMSFDVYHLGTTAIPANEWIQAKRVYGAWIVDVQYCS
jgi:hypothetical protein